jgi:hypothetical protein
LVDDQVSTVVWPAVIVAGLKDTAQLGGEAEAPTVTLAVQVLVAPELSATVRIQLWPANGEKTVEPLVAEKVPFPRFPVQL